MALQTVNYVNLFSSVNGKATTLLGSVTHDEGMNFVFAPADGVKFTSGLLSEISEFIVKMKQGNEPR